MRRVDLYRWVGFAVWVVIGFLVYRFYDVRAVVLYVVGGLCVTLYGFFSCIAFDDEVER